MTAKELGDQPAWPCGLEASRNESTPGDFFCTHEGMTKREAFALGMVADDRLVKCIRAMDDTALAMFAIFPDSEREEWITEAASFPIEMPEVEKILKRLTLEAHAIARVRVLQADALLTELAKTEAAP